MAMLECDKLGSEEQFPARIKADGWIELTLDIPNDPTGEALYRDSHYEKVAVYDNGGTLVADMRED